MTSVAVLVLFLSSRCNFCILHICWRKLSVAVCGKVWWIFLHFIIIGNSIWMVMVLYVKSWFCKNWLFSFVIRHRLAASLNLLDWLLYHIMNDFLLAFYGVRYACLLMYCLCGCHSASSISSLAVWWVAQCIMVPSTYSCMYAVCLCVGYPVRTNVNFLMPMKQRQYRFSVVALFYFVFLSLPR